MDKKTIDQNESIQDGLERFLDEEINPQLAASDPAYGQADRGGEKTSSAHVKRENFDLRQAKAAASKSAGGAQTEPAQELYEDAPAGEMHRRRDLQEEVSYNRQGAQRSGSSAASRSSGQQNPRRSTVAAAGQGSRQAAHSSARTGSGSAVSTAGNKGSADRNRRISSNRSYGREEERDRRDRKYDRTEEGDRDSRRYDYEDKDDRAVRKEKREKVKKSKRDKEKKGKKKKGSKAKKVLVILLLVLLAVGLWWYFMVGSVYKNMNHDSSDPNGTLAGSMKEDGVINVLLIGNDSRQNSDDGRSDAMILVSISNKTKTIHMTSLLRDMYVDIPGHDPNRINAAYAKGGAPLLCETIEQNLGISVNRYAIVNFQAFAALVDAVGGIELEVTNEEVQWINAYLNEYNLLEGRELTTDYLDTSLSGKIHLNGPQALAYCRNRYIGTDFGRTERQRKVLSAAAKKLPAALASNSSQLTDEVFSNLTTNLSKMECYELSLNASKFLTYEQVQNVVPAEGTYANEKIRGMAVLKVDFEANRQLLQKEIYGKE